MSTFVRVNTYVHAVTYVTDKLLTSIKTIVRLGGLDPAKLTITGLYKSTNSNQARSSARLCRRRIRLGLVSGNDITVAWLMLLAA